MVRCSRDDVGGGGRGGGNCGTGKAVYLVEDYGAPQVWVDTVVEGAAQWEYDVWFTGPTLGDVLPLEVLALIHISEPPRPY